MSLTRTLALAVTGSATIVILNALGVEKPHLNGAQ